MACGLSIHEGVQKQKWQIVGEPSVLFGLSHLSVVKPSPFTLMPYNKGAYFSPQSREKYAPLFFCLGRARA
jgi:hypothetical protein